MIKETIEQMKWTNEIWHQFRKYLPFSAFFGHFYEKLETFHHFLRISVKFWQNSINFRRKMTKFIDQNRNEMKFHFIPAKKFDGFLLEFWGGSGAKAKRSCRARKMRKNEPTLAIVAVHTEENEPLKVWGVSFHYFNRILTSDPDFRPLQEKFKRLLMLLRDVSVFFEVQANSIFLLFEK